MKRGREFQEANPKPTYVNDTRFGLRKIYLNPNENAKLGVYFEPGRGPNGEHNN